MYFPIQVITEIEAGSEKDKNLLAVFALCNVPVRNFGTGWIDD